MDSSGGLLDAQFRDLSLGLPQGTAAQIRPKQCQNTGSLRERLNQNLCRPSSENGVASEDGDDCMDCRGRIPQGTAAVSTTSEEAHSETGQKTRGKEIPPPLREQTSKEPHCTISGNELLTVMNNRNINQVEAVFTCIMCDFTWCRLWT